MEKINTHPYSLLTLILAAALSCSAPRNSQPALAPGTMKLADQKMQVYINHEKLPCISNLVLKDGKMVHRQLTGYASIEKGTPVEENTLFRIYSMSKPITAAALMILYDEGKFRLNDPVSDYIPEFKHTSVWENGKEVAQEKEFTIRQLLTHTAGFSYGWGPSPVDSLYREAGSNGIWSFSSLAEMTGALAAIPLKNKPGSKWEYSVSIDIAGYLVEVLSGTTLDVFMQTRIFDPLGMTDTGFSVSEADFDRLAMIYTQDSENGKLIPLDKRREEVMKPPAILSGGGGLVSTIDDYGRFGQMLLNGGELDGVRILKRATVNLIMSNQMPEGLTFGKGGYGLGGSVSEKGQYAWRGAASTAFVVDPENNMVCLSFTQYVPGMKHPFADEFITMVRKAIKK